MELGRRVPGPPPDEFCFDILGIQVFRDSLWAFTSAAREDGNQRLVDVFDLEFPSALVRHNLGWTLISDEGFLFVPEEDEEGLVSIGKYWIPPFPSSSRAQFISLNLRISD